MLEFLTFALFLERGEGLFFGLEKAGLPQVEILEPSKLPVKKRGQKSPKLLESERAAIFALDLGSGKVLLEKNADRAQPIASLTKIMTALVILDAHDLEAIVSVPLEATQVAGAKVDLFAYEKLRVKTLLEAILIPSANDAAVALAVFDAGSEEDFAEKMNQMAAKLELKSAKFWNATGLDLQTENGEIRTNQMSARDVSKMTRIALRNPFFAAAVQQPHFYGTSVDERFFHEKASTNQLLGSFLNLKGVKTGFTKAASECFVALGQKDENEVLTVILGSQDRFGETKNFLSWIYDRFEWE